MRVADLLAECSTLLKNAGVEQHELDGRLLLEFTLGKSRSELFLAAREILDSALVERYRELIARRAAREPIAYITGEQEFWSLTFTVSPDVLIPRPETEFLLEQVFSKTIKENFSRGSVVDLCCGSGVIATVLAKETGKQVIAIDISPEALEISDKNFERHQVVGSVQRIHGDLLAPMLEEGNCSLIVSNPPYVSREDVAYNLEPEVAQFEPHLALDGGKRGMELIRVIRKQLEEVLLPGGQFFMEFGADQGEEIIELFSGQVEGRSGFSTVEILQDYAGRDRVLHAIKK